MPFGTRLTPCAPRIRRASQRLLPRPCRSQAPFATSGRFRKPNRPETPRGADVSPGRRSQRRQPPPKTVQKSRTHGEIGDHFLRNRPEPAGHKRLPNSDTLFASKTGTPNDKLQASKKVFKRSREIGALSVRRHARGRAPGKQPPSRTGKTPSTGSTRSIRARWSSSTRSATSARSRFRAPSSLGCRAHTCPGSPRTAPRSCSSETPRPTSAARWS